MKPFKFAEAGFTWKGWPGSPGRDEVGDLPAIVIEDRSISCWKLSWKERFLVLFNGFVWLSITGKTSTSSHRC